MARIGRLRQRRLIHGEEAALLLQPDAVDAPTLAKCGRCYAADLPSTTVSLTGSPSASSTRELRAPSERKHQRAGAVDGLLTTSYRSSVVAQLVSLLVAR